MSVSQRLVVLSFWAPSLGQRRAADEFLLHGLAKRSGSRFGHVEPPSVPELQASFLNRADFHGNLKGETPHPKDVPAGSAGKRLGSLGYEL